MMLTAHQRADSMRREWAKTEETWGDGSPLKPQQELVSGAVVLVKDKQCRQQQDAAGGSFCVKEPPST